MAGHKTLSQTLQCTTEAQHEGGADPAFGKLIARPDRERNLVNLPKGPPMRLTTLRKEIIFCDEW
ncbi:hypothetical protein QO033_04315 [Pseudodonghicola sp. IC7]|uniref:Uncharacterized protein n=1 Tax=Pseudodonghicola flavimaris TaxID=3050036 RepID=A0ABT7EX17_9RHOB|nr:hypothetical protein [Pseudodonghicola flavimaris]